jgi:hypothetical protein
MQEDYAGNATCHHSEDYAVLAISSKSRGYVGRARARLKKKALYTCCSYQYE